MPTQYKYNALAANGQRQSGVMSAEHRDRVLERLLKRNLTPISIKEVPPKKSFSLWGFRKRNYYDQAISFTSHLSTLYKAGIPILKALSLIKIGGHDSPFNKAIEKVRIQIQAGRSLSEAMEEFKDLFPNVCISSIAAGEESGKLDIILDEQSAMLEKELELVRSLKSGLRYPLIVMFAIVAAIIVLIMFVVPKFVSFYDQFGADLPLPTKILIGTEQFIAHNWPIILVGIVFIIIGVKKLLAHEEGRRWVDRNLLKLPIFGNLIIKGNVARFTMMFHILFQSGLPIVHSLEMLSESVPNTAIGDEVRKMAELLKSGRDSHITKDEFQYFPEMALQMITIGLESGSLTEMLKQISEYLSREVQYTTRHLTAILEPLMTLVLGLFVLIMALAIFLPMWNLVKVLNS